MSSEFKKAGNVGKKIGMKNRKKCIDEPAKCGHELGKIECSKKTNKCKRIQETQEIECIIGSKNCAEELSEAQCDKIYKHDPIKALNCQCNANQKIYGETKNINAIPKCKTLRSYKGISNK